MTILFITVVVLLVAGLAALAILYNRIYGKCAALENENRVLNALNARLNEDVRNVDVELRNMQAVREEQFVRIASLESENRSLNQYAEAQKEQYKAALEQMRVEFKAMASDALEKNSELFNKQTQEKLANILSPFNNDLKLFREKVDCYYGEESKQRFSLQENIKNLIEANQRISRDAVNLTNAIVGTNNNKFQGDWGETILEQILEITLEENADAVLIAGDVYDKSVPSAEAVTLFDDFLCRLASAGIPAMLISGNHDSPERLAFGHRLMEESGIHISPVYQGSITSVTLSDRHGDIVFWLLPFLKPAHVKRFYPEESIDSYTDACRVALSHAEIDTQKRNVLLTHQFVTGAATCESEELSVGGSDNVDASVFEDFDYVALGHIHGPQNIGSNRIRYCGTPLKYSFSEEKHHKSITVVQLEEKGDLTVTLRPLTPRQDLRSIRGDFQQIMEGNPSQDYLHIILTNEEDVPEAIGKLRLLYPNIMKLSYDNTRTRTSQIIDGATEIQRKSPLELFDELYQLQNNQPMSDTQRSFTQSLIEAIWEENP